MIAIAQNYFIEVSIGDGPRSANFITKENFYSLAIQENTEMFVTTGILVLEDTGGYLLERMPLVSGESITLKITREKYLWTFKGVLMNFEPSSAAPTPGFSQALTLYFMDSRIKPLTQRTYTDGYEGDTAGFAQKLAEKVGAAGYDVKPSAVAGKWFMPNWTIAQGIRFLAEKSKIETGGYMYFWDRDGIFHFKPYSEFIRQSPVLKLDMNYIRKEGTTDTTVWSKDLKVFGTSLLSRGGRGRFTSVFDWNTGDFRELSVDLSKLKLKSNTNTLLLRDSDVETHNRLDIQSGRVDDNLTDKYHEADMEFRVLNMVNNLVVYDISCPGNMILKAGQTLELVKNSVYDQKTFDPILSGKWLITGVVHSIREDWYATRLILSRNGLNVTGGGLMKPSGGKV